MKEVLLYLLLELYPDTRYLVSNMAIERLKECYTFCLDNSSSSSNKQFLIQKLLLIHLYTRTYTIIVFLTRKKNRIAYMLYNKERLIWYCLIELCLCSKELEFTKDWLNLKTRFLIVDRKGWL